ncbi:regulation of response to stimulus [Branchiostoma belcheri]|nr:regulation of response to stimulus [Branchiostoma belcheri]
MNPVSTHRAFVFLILTFSAISHLSASQTCFPDTSCQKRPLASCLPVSKMMDNNGGTANIRTSAPNHKTMCLSCGDVKRHNTGNIKQSLSSVCSEAWSESGGMSIGLKGESRLRFFPIDVQTSGNSVAPGTGDFSMVVTRQIKQTATGDNRDQFVPKVDCVAVLFDGKEHSLYHGPTKKRGHVEGAKCLARKAVSNEDKMVEANTTFVNTTVTGRGNTEDETDRSKEQKTRHASNEERAIRTQGNPMYPHGTSQSGSIQANQTDNTYNEINEDEVYDPSGHYYSEIKDQDTGGGRTVASHNDQQNGNTYNEINEDEVYDPSGHYYSEIKDEDIRNAGRSVFKSVCPRKFHEIEEEHLDNVAGQSSVNGTYENDDDDSLASYMYVEQDSQSENFENDSLASYAGQTSPRPESYEDMNPFTVIDEVRLSVVDDVGDNTVLYKIGTRSVASVKCRLERCSPTKSADQGQTTYGMTDCTETSNDTYICTPVTQVNVATDHTEESAEEHSQSISGADEHSQSISDTDEHSQIISGTDEHSQSIFGTDEHSQSILGTDEHSRSISGTDEHSQSISGTDEHSQSISGTGEHSQSISGTDEHSQSIFGTDEHPQSISGTDEHSQSISGTDEHSQSISGTDEEDSVEIESILDE